jgi:hypothetical protein
LLNACDPWYGLIIRVNVKRLYGLNQMRSCSSQTGIRNLILIATLLNIFRVPCFSQDSLRSRTDTSDFSGQLALWANYNHNNKLPFGTGLRYIPTIYLGSRLAGNDLIDFEASANISGNFTFHPFDTINADAKLKPYRLWMRYSTRQLELRLGLQKINFGSASILRPLMWFDQMDPRDPLQLTDGVWGLLTRYYFLNNANIWLWGLYGNKNPRGWELVPVNKGIPEYGGRIQIPVPRGEAAFSYNHRIADNSGMEMFDQHFEKIPEDRFGIDAKWDLSAGLWIEGSWTRKRTDLGLFTNQEVINAGIDYTFNLGTGLYAAYEHLILSYDKLPFRFTELTSFSLLTLSYQAGLFDKISTIVYFNWTKGNVYNFITWQKQFDNIIIYLMGYWNPADYELPAQMGSTNYFSGKGIQIMFVLNH